MKFSKSLMCIFCGVFMINAYRGTKIEVDKPTHIDAKSKKLLTDIMVSHPERLSFDERFFIKFPSTLPVRERLVFVGSVEKLLQQVATDINKSMAAEVYTHSDIQKVLNFFYLETKDYALYKEHVPAVFSYIDAMSECTCFARMSHNFRKVTEEKIIEHLKKNFPDKKQRITITEFASGDLFQLMILGTRIINAGFTNLRFIGLDTKYENLMIRASSTPWLTKGTQLMSTLMLPTSFFDIASEADKMFFRRLFKQAQEMQNPSQKMWDTYFDITNSFETYNIFRQFVSWFNALAPATEFIMYTDAQDYIHDCAEHAALKSDVLIAIDYFSFENYHFWDDLRRKALKDTGIAFSVATVDVEKVSPFEDPSEDREFYLSEGTPMSLLHFKFELAGPKLKYKDKKPKFEPHYMLKQVSEIPQYILREETGKIISAIPEILPGKNVSSKEELD